LGKSDRDTVPSEKRGKRGPLMVSFHVWGDQSGGGRKVPPVSLDRGSGREESRTKGQTTFKRRGS